MLMASFCPPSAPQTVGPIAGTSDGPMTTAPAPSAKRNAVLRSWGSIQSVSFSTPITTTYVELPLRTMSLASETPKQKPAQAAEMSNAAALTAPIRAATSVDADGVWYGWVTVATRTMPTSDGSMPAASIALRAADSAMSTTDSSSAAKRRSMMPERS